MVFFLNATNKQETTHQNHIDFDGNSIHFDFPVFYKDSGILYISLRKRLKSLTLMTMQTTLKRHKIALYLILSPKNLYPIR